MAGMTSQVPSHVRVVEQVHVWKLHPRFKRLVMMDNGRQRDSIGLMFRRDLFEEVSKRRTGVVGKPPIKQIKLHIMGVPAHRKMSINRVSIDCEVKTIGLVFDAIEGRMGLDAASMGLGIERHQNWGLVAKPGVEPNGDVIETDVHPWLTENQ